MTRLSDCVKLISNQLAIETFFLQTRSDVNCFEDDNNTACIKQKTTQKNTVKFTLLRLKSGTKYYICVNTNDARNCPALRSCSNGFTVDTEAPLAGRVYVGSHDNELAYHVTDSYTYVSWTGFVDQPLISYLPRKNHGIARYEIAIGKTRNIQITDPVICISENVPM